MTSTLPGVLYQVTFLPFWGFNMHFTSPLLLVVRQTTRNTCDPFMHIYKMCAMFQYPQDLTFRCCLQGMQSTMQY